MSNPQLQNRRYLFIALFIVIAIIYTIRIFNIQVLDKSYQMSADNNVLRYVTVFPARGLMFDRNGELLVYNEATYDLQFIPRQSAAFDTVKLCTTINISTDDFRKAIKKAKKYSTRKASTVSKQISAIEYAHLQEIIHQFPGFYVQSRSMRKYRKNIAAHALGYVSEVNKKQTETSEYYKMGDYIGQEGIEKSYEKYLRGKKGTKIFLVDVHNRTKGSYKNGKYDSLAIVGKNLTLTIDAKLQAYGERLMKNKKGSIVVLEPATGEVLALISSPTFPANSFVGKQRGDNYEALKNNPDKPLYNRALKAQYPPGSTFKTINALIGLHENVITTQSKFACTGGYHVGSFTVGCHHNSLIDFNYSIAGSCNAYYCYTYTRILNDKKFPTIDSSYTNWRKHVLSFGIGQRTGIDLPSEGRGNIPKASFFDKYYGKNRWTPLMLISMSIGQGELITTPVQLANMTATIANRGFYYPPHLVKSIEGEPHIDSFYLKPQHTSIDKQHFEPVIEGMQNVIKYGTATSAQIQGIEVCGKTGTAENPHGKDHSIFTAFAPKNNPSIAISVYIENGGFGATWAAPIAKLMIEKYLNDTISDPYVEKRILEANLYPQKQNK